MYNLDINIKNIGVLFLAPMVFKDKITISKLTENFYKICLSIYNDFRYDDKLIVVSKTPLIRENKSYINMNYYLQTTYDKEYKEYLTIINIPEEYEDCVMYIVSGKYSQLPNYYKVRLLNFWEQPFKSQLGGILYKIKQFVFSQNDLVLNIHKINNSYEYFRKPFMSEMIYGLV